MNFKRLKPWRINFIVTNDQLQIIGKKHAAKFIIKDKMRLHLKSRYDYTSISSVIISRHRTVFPFQIFFKKKIPKS